MSDQDEFQVITFPSEQTRVINEIAARAPTGVGVDAQGKSFYFRVTGANSSAIGIEILGDQPRAISAGEELELLFTFDDGRYLWKTQVSHAHSASRIDLGRTAGTLARLQRRNNFRTSVPGSFKISFRVLSFKNQSVSKTELALIDISAGGARVRWPAGGLVEPQLEEKVAAVISTGTGRDIEVFGRIKNLLRDSKGLQVGLEFEGLSGRDEQFLLSLCLQMRRAQSSVV